jgi:hypothetical protein
MSKSFKLKVAEPCHEDWQNMSPNAKGRHCQSCAKTVVDFSIMTDAEIVSFFKNKPQNVCGRFAEKQLEKQYSIVTPSQSMSYARAAALAAGLFVAGCQELPPQYSKENMEKVEPLNLKIHDNLRAVYGTVQDSINHPLIGAEITSDNNHHKVFSDENGKFVIIVERNIPLVSLTFNHSGFASRHINIDFLANPTEDNITIALESNYSFEVREAARKKEMKENHGLLVHSMGAAELVVIEEIDSSYRQKLLKKCLEKMNFTTK